LIRIHCTPNKGFALKISDEWTHYRNEHEVLLSCYNVYRVIDIKEENNSQDGTVQTVIDLELLDYHDYHDDYCNKHSLEDGLIQRKDNKKRDSSTVWKDGEEEYRVCVLL